MSPEPADLKTSVKSAEFTAAAASLANLPPPLTVEVAFAGRSNVGKSSLMNCLLSRRNLVRVSGTPGCTRTLSLFDAELGDGARITMVDLPGYGFARRSKTERGAWAEMIEGYLLERVTLRAVVSIIDVRRGLEDDDRDLLTMMAAPSQVSRPQVTTLVVATKLDKLPLNKQKLELERVRKGAGVPVLGFSSETGFGRDELWRRIRKAAGI
jgi:GTP-binding protein